MPASIMPACALADGPAAILAAAILAASILADGPASILADAIPPAAAGLALGEIACKIITDIS